MRNIHFSAIVLLCYTLLVGCSKDNNGVVDDNDSSNLSGMILYDNGENTYALDLRTGARSIYFERNTYSLNGWDVSWDGLTRLETSSIAGDFDNLRFRFISTANGAVTNEVIYPRTAGEDRLTSGQLSADNSQILIEPDLNHGIVLLDADGNMVKHLQMVNGKELTLGDKAMMLADKSILFTFEKKFILKTSPPYEEIVPIKEMNYSDWGNLHSSKDGSKLSVRIDKHIYVMNSDGSDLMQVTESQTREREGVFSPDGNFLLIAADHKPAALSPGSANLNIIPLDGNKHVVGANPSPAVIEIRTQNSANVERADNYMFWR